MTDIHPKVFPPAPPLRRALEVWGAPVFLLLLNIVLVARMFAQEYSASLGSNEGQFIAIARGVAQHMGDLLWWPIWSCGVPFQNAYSPLQPVTVGLFSLLTGNSPALAFHQVTAAMLCLGPPAVYVMARILTGRAGASFAAAAAFSLTSPCALLPWIGRDVGSVLNLRRVQIVGTYGEGPHVMALVLIPLAILFLHLALTRRKLIHCVLAGVFLGASVLTNAFSAVILISAVAALLAAEGFGRLRYNLPLLAAIGGLSYLWISPAMPPSVTAAMRMNQAGARGDYPFTAQSFVAAVALALGFILLWLALRRVTPHMRFFALFAWLMTGIVVVGVVAHINVVPQPHRYQIAMDMSLCLLAAFTGGWMLERFAPRATPWVALILVLAMAIQARHAISYAHSQIRPIDITTTGLYRFARWVDTHMDGRRIMAASSYSFALNDFTDTPQVHGGQEPTLPDIKLRIAVFQLYTGMGAGAREGEIAVTWLKALGARAVHVPGPTSPEFYKPYANPNKFEGLLPVLWREGGDTVYEVPTRHDSLAHVMSPKDLVRDMPDGVNLDQLGPYVAALDSPAYPEAKWAWTSRHSGVIQTTAQPGQVVSMQITYHPGWRAEIAGVRQPTAPDGLNFLVIKPDCHGDCRIALTYDGGPELRITGLLSLAAMLLVAALFVIARTRLVK